MHATTFAVLSLLFAARANSAYAGQTKPEPLEFSRADLSESTTLRPSTPVSSLEEAEIQVVMAAQDILDHTGLTMNFSIVPSNIPNAMAFMGENGARLLMYNPRFINNLHDRLDPDWGIIIILAHEIGRHLQGHIFVHDPYIYHRELEADEFSGFAMYRMGATLAEAQFAMRKLAVDLDLPTHPNRDTRLAAIARGWFKAQEITAHEALIAKRRDAAGKPDRQRP